MQMVAKLCTMNCEELKTFYTNRFNNNDGRIFIERIDIKKAGEFILRSRKILLTFTETQEFEKNFLRLRRKIPATFFFRKSVELSTLKQ